MAIPEHQETAQERELRERIEREISQKRQRAPAPTVPPSPDAAPSPTPAPSSSTSLPPSPPTAPDTAPPAAAPAVAETPALGVPAAMTGAAAGSDSRQSIEDEIRRRIESEVQQRLARTDSPVAMAATDSGKDKGRDGGKTGSVAKGKDNGKKGKTAISTTRAKAGSTPQSTTSERDKILIEEKAKIDAKLKRRAWMMYPAITLVFGLIAWFGYKLAKPWIQAQQQLQQTDVAPIIIQRPMQVVGIKSPGDTNSSRPPRPSGTSRADAFASVKANAVKLAADGKYQDAIDMLEKYGRENSTDLNNATAEVDRLRHEYLDGGKASADWKALQTSVATAVAGDDESALHDALVDLMNFRKAHPGEVFVTPPSLAAAAGRYFRLTGRYADVGTATAPTVGDRPWATDSDWRKKAELSEKFGNDRETEVEGTYDRGGRDVDTTPKAPRVVDPDEVELPPGFEPKDDPAPAPDAAPTD